MALESATVFRSSRAIRAWHDRPRRPRSACCSAADWTVRFCSPICCESGERVQPIYVAGGLVWEQAELAAARAIAGPIWPVRALRRLVVLDLPLADLYGRHWSTDGRQTPDGTTPDEAVYLPGRNPLLLVKSRLWCQLNGIGRLALGTLENNPFADATAEFFASFAAVLDRAMSGSVALERPLARHTQSTR